MLDWPNVYSGTSPCLIRPGEKPQQPPITSGKVRKRPRKSTKDQKSDSINRQLPGPTYIAAPDHHVAQLPRTGNRPGLVNDVEFMKPSRRHKIQASVDKKPKTTYHFPLLKKSASCHHLNWLPLPATKTGSRPGLVNDAECMELSRRHKTEASRRAAVRNLASLNSIE